MIEVLYCSYINDEDNSNTGLGFSDMFDGAESVSFIITAHQGGDSPNTSGVKVEVLHCDTQDGDYVPVSNAVVHFSQPGAHIADVVVVNRADIKAFGRVTLIGTGVGDPAGAGSVTAVW